MKTPERMMENSNDTARCNGQHLSPREPGEEAELAMLEIEAGDLVHAKFHASWALVLDPSEPLAHAAANRLLARVLDPLAFTEIQGQEVTLADAVFHTWALMHQEEPGAALDMLTQCLQTSHVPRLVTWLSLWIPSHIDARDIPDSMWVRVLGGIMGATIGDTIQDEVVADAIRALSPVLYDIADRSSEAMVRGFTGSVLRKIGEHERALELAIRAYRQEKSSRSATFVALVYSAMEEHEKVLAYYKEAVKLDPENVGAMLDIGDRYLTLEQFGESLAWYRRALEVEPENPWALTHSAVSHFLLDGSLDALEDLEGYLWREVPTAMESLGSLREHTPAYLVWIPEPSEAMINLARDVLGQDFELGDVVSVAASELEAPSALVSVAEMLGTMPEVSILDSVVFTGVGDDGLPREIDPREPWGPVTRTFWAFDGFKPEPTLPRIEGAWVDRVGRLARAPLLMPLLVERARSMAPEATRESVSQLSSAMFHPPDTDLPVPAWTWRQRCIWASVALVAMMREECWFGSLKREVLFDLLRGVWDWTTTAAVTMLGVLLEDMPEDSAEHRDILEALEALHRVCPDRSQPCWEEALVTVRLEHGAGSMSAEERERLKKVLAELRRS